MLTEQIIAQFPVGNPNTLEPITQGLINATYKVTSTKGVFILQRMSTIVPRAMIEDAVVITSALRKEGFSVPELVLSISNSQTFEDPEGRSWRLYRYIPGKTLDHVVDAGMALEAGQLIGRMHKALAALDYLPQAQMSHFHNTSLILSALERTVPELPPEAQTLAREVLKIAPPLIMKNDGGAPQIIHGDLKISNIIFDERNKAVGIIDFDTILYRSRAIDMGDAYRSWCNKTSEDDADATFDLDIFEAAYAGYEEGFGAGLKEKALHLQATKQITLELTARFLTDIITDNYFGFDPTRYPSRKAHNLARAKGQYHLFQSMPE